IYQTGGSHGCINTPTANMSQLYEMVEVGMPVIMFY
ncbi:L,D-transpeptidase, partial [uncultured Acetatifactor sp.]